MAKTETNIPNLKINRGTYANIQANISSIGENELIITTDKNVPIPVQADADKIVRVDSNGEYELDTFTSMTDADIDLALSAEIITATITNGTAEGDTVIAGAATVTIVPSEGYVLPSSVTVVGAASSYNSSTGVISLSNATGEVSITAECEAGRYNVTFTASGNWNNAQDGHVQIYDGQDNTGTLLLNQNPANKSAFPMTLQVSSGHCLVAGYGFATVGELTSSDFTKHQSTYAAVSSYFDINKDGSINISITDFND